MNDLYNYWHNLYEEAKVNMHKVAANLGTLIEIAAQHPLINGEFPNEEFEKRLLLGIELYNKIPDCKFYIPGSIHIPDKCSLSLAGKTFLLQHDIPERDIFAEDANIKYKGTTGVYNSTDECYVACQLFRDLGYGHLHCVCSSGQMMRKVISYISFGYVPYMHTVSCDVMFHDYINELFKFIPIVLEGKQEEEAKRLRKERESFFSFSS